jgi:hypothetical protein
MWNPKPAMKLYPQMMFDLKGPAILGDLEEMQRFGCKNFSDLLMNSILKTFRKYHSDIRGYLHFERIDNDIIKSTKYKYPPRIYWAHPIFELAHRVNNNKKAPFVLRYLNSSDMKYALYCLDNWKSNIKSDAPVIQRGSHTPQMRCFYNPSEVYRAIAKISINLLSYLCNCTF